MAKPRFAGLHPKTFLGLYGLGGLLLSGALLWAFLGIGEDVPEKGAMTRLDLGVASWLQVHGTERGESVFSFVSLIGSPVLAVVVGVAVLVFAARRDWRRMAVVLVASGGGALLTYELKDIYQRVRPVFAAEFITSANSWSFPSGHAMESLVTFGVLAYLLLEYVEHPPMRRAIVAATALLIGLIGFARLYLGVHFLSDVVGGYVAGGVWLIVCVTGYRFARQRHIGHSKPVPLGPE